MVAKKATAAFFTCVRLILLAALIPIAGYSGAASANDWQVEWDRLVAAAHKEGTLTLAGPQTAATRRVLEKFQEAYPRIKLEYSALHGEFWQRLESERAAGVYAWDVFVGGAGAPTYDAARKGLFVPIRASVIRPDVYEDKYWIGGFAGGFGDNEKKHVFMFNADRMDLVSVNRSKVSEREFNSMAQLLDPRWKGQIVMMDPRQQGSGAMALGTVQKDLGDEAARKFLTEQDPVLTRARRQAAEWVVRGRYPIGLGVVSFYYAPFAERGLTKDIAFVKGVNPLVTSSSGVVTLIANAPHPNAAKVFLNWLLSRDTQEAWSKSTGTNSMRADVKPGNPAEAVSAEQFRSMPHANTEEGAKFFFQRSGAFAQGILK